MGSPYSLEFRGAGQGGSLKSEDLFCNLPEGALKALNTIKFTSGYPKGAVLFIEQEASRGVFILSKAA